VGKTQRPWPIVSRNLEKKVDLAEAAIPARKHPRSTPNLPRADGGIRDFNKVAHVDCLVITEALPPVKNVHLVKGGTESSLSRKPSQRQAEAVNCAIFLRLGALLCSPTFPELGPL
jgi:hypothetical protein